jgi:teichuronic acid biosynthesis glycosyltransferase TuaG
MEKENIVSIITPMYNSGNFIEDTITSVLDQTYPYWEMIIIDDCSTDKSVEIVKKYTKRDKRIKLIKLPRQHGPAMARNIGIKNAQGRFIAFLDSDDLWKPLKLEKQIKFMLENDIAFSFTAYDIIDEAGNYISTISVPEKVNYKSLLKRNVIGCLTAMYDTLKLGKIFMPNIEKRQDYGLWLRILKQIKEGYGLNQSLAIYRLRSNSISRKKIPLLKYHYKLLRHCENLSLSKTLYYLSFHILWKILKVIKYKYY